MIEASYSYGALGEEAVCQVTVYGWDERYWGNARAIDADLELTLVDPAQPDGPALWSGRLTKAIDVSDLARSTVEGHLYQRAIERAAEELLSALPERDTSPGRR